MRIRALRKERGLSLEALAQKSGVAIGSLSRLENGKASGNFRTHEKIAEALRVPLPDLYRGLETPTQDATLLEPQAKEVETFTYDEKAQAILLTTQVSKKSMLPQLLVLQPGGQTATEQYPKGTERWLFGLEGAVEIQVGEASHRLAQGSTLYLDGSVPHQLRNASRVTAKVISVTTPVVL